MDEQRRIRGVMFDAGGVLTRPIGGRWNPRYDFEAIVAAHHPQVQANMFPRAIDAGQRFLDAGMTTANRTEYHRTMLAVLGVVRPSEQLLTELEAPAAGAVASLAELLPIIEAVAPAGPKDRTP